LFVSRIVLAPFFYVGFADFWLADQLNSLGQAVKDFKYLGRLTLSPPLDFSKNAIFQFCDSGPDPYL
jgi:hypothetical protein